MSFWKLFFIPCFKFTNVDCWYCDGPWWGWWMVVFRTHRSNRWISWTPEKRVEQSLLCHWHQRCDITASSSNTDRCQDKSWQYCYTWHLSWHITWHCHQYDDVTWFLTTILNICHNVDLISEIMIVIWILFKDHCVLGLDRRVKLFCIEWWHQNYDWIIYVFSIVSEKY